MRRNDDEDEDVSFRCINDTSSGDCGFKSKVCTGGTAWELVHSEDLEHPDDDEKIMLPFTSSPGNECSLDVCLECLFPNSDNDTVVQRRKKRDTHVTGAGECLNSISIITFISFVLQSVVQLSVCIRASSILIGERCPQSLSAAKIQS